MNKFYIEKSGKIADNARWTGEGGASCLLNAWKSSE
jgi:hypothetical protein